MTNQQPSVEELKECPWCGKLPEIIVIGKEDYACCTNKCCPVQPSSTPRGWNRRTKPSPAEVSSEGLQEAFAKFLVKHLGPSALAGDKMSLYEAATLAFSEGANWQLSQQSTATVERELTFEAWWGQATGYSQMTKMELAEFAWKACASMRQPPAHADLLSVLQEAIDGMGGSYGVWAPKAKAVVAKYAGCALNQRLAVKEGEACKHEAVFHRKSHLTGKQWLVCAKCDHHREVGEAVAHTANDTTHPVSDDQQAKDAALWRHCVQFGFPVRNQTASSGDKRWVAFSALNTHYAATPYDSVCAALSATKQEG
jgi:hypothetical protein